MRWDRLESGTLCCKACTWTHLSSSNKTQRNYEGLKVTAHMCSWGKFWTQNIQKDRSPTATSEEPGAKTGCWEQKQGTVHILCTTPPEGWANNLTHPSGLTPGHTPTLPHLRDQLNTPLWEQAREHIACSCSTLLQEGASKSLARIFSPTSSQFLLIKEAKNPGQNSLTPRCVVCRTIFVVCIM